MANNRKYPTKKQLDKELKFTSWSSCQGEASIALEALRLKQVKPGRDLYAICRVLNATHMRGGASGMVRNKIAGSFTVSQLAQYMDGLIELPGIESYNPSVIQVLILEDHI